jgi:hypothetical protein
VETTSCPDVVPFWALGPHIWRRGPLERRGFQVMSEAIVSRDEAERRRRAILRILDGEETADGWDMETYPWNVAQVRRLAETSAWEDVYDRDYTMVLDLERA